jgi:hypothetical protein
MDAIPAVAWMKDADGRYIYLQQGLEQRPLTLQSRGISGQADPRLSCRQAVAAKLAENDAIVLGSDQGQEFH